MGIAFSKENEQSMIDEIKRFFSKEKEEQLSDFQAKFYLDFMVRCVGVYIYNQAIADAQAFLGEKVEEMFVLEKRVEGMRREKDKACER